MLTYSTLQTHSLPVALTSEEDRKLRLAFGRFAETGHRQAGEDVVSAHYEKRRCFRCDCRRDTAKAPLLFLVTGTHIRREADGKGTPHDDGCDFARDPDEQKKLVISYQKPKDDRGLSLVRNFSEGKAMPQGNGMVTLTTKCTRPTLARALCSLLNTAQLDRFFSATPLHGDREEQNRDLRAAAETFTVAAGQPLNHWLATSLGDYYRLKERLNQSMVTWKRPHGLFIETFDRIENNILYPKRQDLKPIPVTGRLAVYGEARALCRPPYLVIGLVAQPDRKAKSVELLNAYAHPCVAWDRLTLVDSQLERETLRLLIDCRDELAAKHGIVVNIKKPMYDIGPPETENAREICKPDFVLYRRGNYAPVVIETMGFNDATYRKRKRRMRTQFEHIEGVRSPAPVIEHDRFTVDKTIDEIDADFQKMVCKIIIHQS